jgi:hypothetical protein
MWVCQLHDAALFKVKNGVEVSKDSIADYLTDDH